MLHANSEDNFLGFGKKARARRAAENADDNASNSLLAGIGTTIASASQGISNTAKPASTPPTASAGGGATPPAATDSSGAVVQAAPSSKMGLYIGLGAGVLILIGVVIFFATRGK